MCSSSIDGIATFHNYMLGKKTNSIARVNTRNSRTNDREAENRRRIPRNKVGGAGMVSSPLLLNPENVQ